MTIRRRLVVAVIVAAAFVPLSGCKSSEPPSEVPAAQSVEIEGWPFCVCGNELAATMLDQIETAANDARAANMISIPRHTQIITRVTKCRANFNPTPLTYAEHCSKLTLARNAAWGGQWAICSQELEHGH